MKNAIKLLSLNLIAGLTFQACSREPQPPSEMAAIVGKDSFKQSSDKRLLDLVGRLRSGYETCTAFAVDQNHIITAHHCLGGRYFSGIKNIFFRTVNGIQYTISGIEDYPQADVAILETTNYFPAESLPLQLTDASSSGILELDETTNSLFIHQDCALTQAENVPGTWTHLCNTQPGNSGSPLFKDGKLFGVHIGYSNKLQKNVAISPDKSALSGMKELDKLEITDEGCWSQCVVSTAGGAIGGAVGGAGAGAAIGGAIGGPTGVIIGASIGGSIGGVGGGLQGAAQGGCMTIDSCESAHPDHVEANSDDGETGSSTNGSWDEKADREGGEEKFYSGSNVVGSVKFSAHTKLAIPRGFFAVPGLPGYGIYWSNGGDAFCWVPSPKYITGPVRSYSFNIYKLTYFRQDGACPGM